MLGGIRIGNFKRCAKWIWRFISEDSTPWCKLIVVKHYSFNFLVWPQPIQYGSCKAL